MKWVYWNKHMYTIFDIHMQVVTETETETETSQKYLFLLQKY